MKTTTDLIAINLENLTALWKTAGVAFDSYYKTPNFEYSEIKNSEWPNRLWLSGDIHKETISLIKNKIVAATTAMTVPTWNVHESKLLENNGFKLKFEQAGMSLQPTQSFIIERDITIKLVTNDADAQLWSAIFQKAFGYVITSETINRIYNKVDFYIGYHNGLPIGTAILYKTNNIMGIHSVGVPPEMRRKGYAEQIMKLLINIVVENQNEYATLQASNMGKNLYFKLGFKEQFTIKNYILE